MDYLGEKPLGFGELFPASRYLRPRLPRAESCLFILSSVLLDAQLPRRVPITSLDQRFRQVGCPYRRVRPRMQLPRLGQRPPIVGNRLARVAFEHVDVAEASQDRLQS